MIPVIAHEDVRVASTEGWVVTLEKDQVKEFKMEHAMALISTGKAEFYKGEPAPEVIEQPTFEVPEDDDDLQEFEEDQNDEKDDLPCTDEVADIDDEPEQAVEAVEEEGVDEDTDLDPVISAVRAVIHRADRKDLKIDGTPKAFAINRELGYIVDSEVRQSAIDIVIQELDKA